MTAAVTAAEKVVPSEPQKKRNGGKKPETAVEAARAAEAALVARHVPD